MATQEEAGRSHQQGPRGILPKGVEDPSEGNLGLVAGDGHSQGDELAPLTAS